MGKGFPKPTLAWQTPTTNPQPASGNGLPWHIGVTWQQVLTRVCQPHRPEVYTREFHRVFSASCESVLLCLELWHWKMAGIFGEMSVVSVLRETKRGNSCNNRGIFRVFFRSRSPEKFAQLVVPICTRGHSPHFATIEGAFSEQAKQL